ncbi:hypothetical protein AB5I41_03775 [Sphingomonas sp. MMS24-JH45]
MRAARSTCSSGGADHRAGARRTWRAMPARIAASLGPVRPWRRGSGGARGGHPLPRPRAARHRDFRTASDAGEPPAARDDDRIFAPIAAQVAEWLGR